MSRTDRQLSTSPRLEVLEDRFLPSVSSPLGSYDPRDVGAKADWGREIEQPPAKAVTQNVALSGMSDLGRVPYDAYAPINLRFAIEEGGHVALIVTMKIPVFYLISPYASLPSVTAKVQPKAHVMTSIQDMDSSDEVFKATTANVSTAGALNLVNRAVSADWVAGLLTQNGGQPTLAPVVKPAMVTETVAPRLIIEGTAILDRAPTPSTPSGLGTIPAEDQPGTPATTVEDATLPGVVKTTIGEETLNVAGKRTERQGLVTDESSLVFGEIEHVLQSLVEPIQLAVKNSNPTMLWTLLATWCIAAGIAYEYMRRRVGVERGWKELKVLSAGRSDL